MATFSDTENVSTTVGAGAVELAVQPVATGMSRMTSGTPLTLTVDAFSTGAPASLQLTAADAPGSNACGPEARSVTASVSADWLPEFHPIPLCDLLDLEHPVVLARVDPTAPISDGVLDVRFSELGGGPLTSQQWDGIFTFTLVQGTAGFSATQDVPVHAGAQNGSVTAPAETPAETQGAQSPPGDAGQPSDPAVPVTGAPPVGSAPTGEESPVGAAPADAEQATRGGGAQ
jgi:hypothetical protein